MKRATRIVICNMNSTCISIHALVKRATNKSIKIIRIKIYFNPRPREEGDLSGLIKIHSEFQISIHALVKRATHRFATAGEVAVISIHALVKRATKRVLR